MIRTKGKQGFLVALRTLLNQFNPHYKRGCVFSRGFDSSALVTCRPRCPPFRIPVERILECWRTHYGIPVDPDSGAMRTNMEENHDYNFLKCCLEMQYGNSIWSRLGRFAQKNLGIRRRLRLAKCVRMFQFTLECWFTHPMCHWYCTLHHFVKMQWTSNFEFQCYGALNDRALLNAKTPQKDIESQYIRTNR